MTTDPKDDFLDTDVNDRAQDVNNSDAGKLTEDAEEQALVDGTLGNERSVPNFEAVGDEPTLTTQGDQEELQQNMAGTTNLTLDQLKHNHHPEA